MDYKKEDGLTEMRSMQEGDKMHTEVKPENLRLRDHLREYGTDGRTDRSCVLDSGGSGQKAVTCCFEHINKSLIVVPYIFYYF